MMRSSTLRNEHQLILLLNCYLPAFTSVQFWSVLLLRNVPGFRLSVDVVEHRRISPFEEQIGNLQRKGLSVSWKDQ